MIFFIKRNSTLPVLKFPLTDRFLEEYGVLKENLNNVAVTFSMVNTETSIYKIANSSAGITKEKNSALYEEDCDYIIYFKFHSDETNDVGNYSGEFKLDFLSDENCGKLTIPSDSNNLIIIITDSITRTTVI